MRLRPLALVVCAPLLACPGDDAGDTAASTAGTSGTETGGSTSTGEPATTEGTGSEASSSSTAADDTTGGGVGPIEACITACERLVECGVQNVPSCGIPCGMIDTAVAGCDAEYLAQQMCAAALSCDDLQAWADAMMSGSGYPCDDEDAAFQGCLAG
jgi:hypothetical protein